jgi:hypothetical protein
VPVFGSPNLADRMYEDTPGFQVTRFAANAALAGNFIAFLHTPNRMRAQYADVGDLPNDSRWDTSQIQSPTDKLMAKWISESVNYYSANYYPLDLDTNGNFVAFQGMIGGTMTADQAAVLYENVITKWRKLHSAEINNYRTWLKDYGNDDK